MKKTLLIGVLLVALGATMAGCNNTANSSGLSNYAAKKLGGTSSEELPPNKKLVNVTWKDTHLWILTRDMKPNEVPETYEFKETSTFGIVEGTVVIKESKK